MYLPNNLVDANGTKVPSLLHCFSHMYGAGGFGVDILKPHLVHKIPNVTEQDFYASFCKILDDG